MLEQSHAWARYLLPSEFIQHFAPSNPVKNLKKRKDNRENSYPWHLKEQKYIYYSAKKKKIQIKKEWKNVKRFLPCYQIYRW